MTDPQQQAPLPDAYLAMSRLSDKVQLARRLADGVLVAIKSCPPENGPDCTDRLRLEADLLGRLTHPNIMQRLAWLPSPAPALVTRYAAGTTLAQRYAGQPAPLEHADLSVLLTPLLSAVAAIHAQGFVHGDLSPHNILIQQDGQPLLLDLDAARPLTSDAATSHMVPNPPSALTTAGFTAPEYYSGDPPVREYSDIYSLAAICYGLMSGHYPPSATDRDADQPLPRPTGDYPPNFIDAVLQALQPDPRQRPANIAAFAATLGLTVPEPTAGTDTGGDASPAPRSDLPATEPIARRPGGLPHPAVSMTSLPDRPRPISATTRTTKRSGLRLLPLALLLTLAAAGLHWGPGWYRSQLQMQWLIDPTGNGDAVSISEALAIAPSGARITILPGTYTESLTVERPVTLRPSEPGTVKIRPASGPCLRYLATTGRIQGLDLATAQATSPSVNSATPCVEVIGGSVVVEDNRINGNQGAALRLSGGSQATIGLNEITAGAGVGIIIDAASGGVVASNHIYDTARSAIVVRDAATPELHCNQIESAGQAGILIEAGSSPAIETNRIQNSAASGIEARSGARPLVRRNLIEMSQQAGLYIHSGAAPRVEDNQILDSGFSGIIISSGARPVLTSNTIDDGGEHGILVLPTAKVTLQGNRILDNLGNGLVIAKGADARAKHNIISGNQKPQTVDGR